MSQAVPVITSAGLASIWNETQDGFNAKITHLGVGLAGYTPNADQESLQQEVGRWEIIDGEQINDTQLYLYTQINNEGIDTSLVDDDGGFWIREIGFYLEDGTLFAVHSVGESGAPEAYKSASTVLDIDYQLVLDAVPAGSVTVINSGIRYNPEMITLLADTVSALGNSNIRYMSTVDAMSVLKNEFAENKEQTDEFMANITLAIGNSNARYTQVVDDLSEVKEELLSLQ